MKEIYIMECDGFYKVGVSQDVKKDKNNYK